MHRWTVGPGGWFRTWFPRWPNGCEGAAWWVGAIAGVLGWAGGGVGSQVGAIPTASPLTAPPLTAPPLTASPLMPIAQARQCPSDPQDFAATMAALIESFPSYANRARWQQHDRPNLDRPNPDRPLSDPPPDRVILAGSLDSTPVSWPEVLPRVNLGRPQRVFFATWERSGMGQDFQRVYWAVFQAEEATWSLANLAYQVRPQGRDATPQPVVAAQTSADAIAIQRWLRDCRRAAERGS